MTVRSNHAVTILKRGSLARAMWVRGSAHHRYLPETRGPVPLQEITPSKLRFRLSLAGGSYAPKDFPMRAGSHVVNPVKGITVLPRNFPSTLASNGHSGTELRAS